MFETNIENARPADSLNTFAVSVNSKKNVYSFEQFEQFILFKIQKAIDPSGNINI